jgi:hypothetical protein
MDCIGDRSRGFGRYRHWSADLNVALTMSGPSVVVATKDQVSSDPGGEAAILTLKNEP